MERKSSGIVAIVVFLLVIGVIFLTQSPVKRDLRTLSKDIQILNDNYKVISAEFGKWKGFTQVSDIRNSLDNTILPKLDNSLETINNTKLKTSEVIALRQQYVDSLEAYRMGADTMLKAVELNDKKKLDEAEAYFQQAEAGIKAFNATYKKLAEENGLRVVE